MILDEYYLKQQAGTYDVCIATIKIALVLNRCTTAQFDSFAQTRSNKFKICFFFFCNSETIETATHSRHDISLESAAGEGRPGNTKAWTRCVNNRGPIHRSKLSHFTTA